jgi:hypothetical protein
VSASSVNWLTTRVSPPTSATHGLSAFYGPPHAHAFHTILHKMATGSFGETAAYRVSGSGVLVISHVLPVVFVVDDGCIQAA